MMQQLTLDQAPLLIRFESKIYRNPKTGCWDWMAWRDHGHGRFHLGPEGKIYAHRFAYQVWIGPIPNGLGIDHLCRNRACVNPSHLEPVTNRINTLRGNTIPARRIAQTHCVHGHPFSDANVRLRPDGTRQCRACDRERSREWRAEHLPRRQEMLI